MRYTFLCPVLAYIANQLRVRARNVFTLCFGVHTKTVQYFTFLSQFLTVNYTLDNYNQQTVYAIRVICVLASDVFVNFLFHRSGANALRGLIFIAPGEI